MHRAGHFGVSLFTVAVLTIPLDITIGVPLAIIMIGTEPLPDYDMQIDAIDHRGYSHTFAGAAAVAIALSGVAGGITFLITEQVTTAPASVGIASYLDYIPSSFAVITLTFIGTILGFTAHFLADMITVGEGYFGIQPFAPVSDWESSIQLCRADNSAWNSALLSLGMLTLIGSGYVQYRLLTGGF